MEQLRPLVGHEKSLKEVVQALHFATGALGAAAVGAMHVTCADESERECVDAFQQGYVQYMLPPLKTARPSAFRLANLGGRYEWGAVRIAEAHFAPADASGRLKLLVVKINAHVAVEDDARGGEPSVRWGVWRRYGTESPCCGALTALLDGGREPFLNDLREAFSSEGRDRVAMLRDTSRVDPIYRALYAAIVSARLQARKAVLDIQDYSPVTASYFLVFPCVTINRHERDTEILCGIYTLDVRDRGRDVTYFGLGDDPAAYEIRSQRRGYVVTDEHLGGERKGRDHRALVRTQWTEHMRGRLAEVRDERLDQIRFEVAQKRHRHHPAAKALLRATLPILSEVAPVPAAVLMFADGVAGIHHAFRVHRLTRELAGTTEARQILDEIHERIDRLDGDHAAALVELLLREHRG